MTTITSSKIRRLISRDEGPKLDFKQRISLRTNREKSEFAKDICAIANTGSGPGYIIVGIEDGTKRLLGVHPSSINEERLQQIVSSRCDPPPNFSVEVVPYRGVDLAIISIPRRGKLHQVKRVGFPIRRGSITDIMTTSEIFDAMQTRARRTRSRPSEYEVFGSSERTIRMRQDTLEGLLELGFSTEHTRVTQYAGSANYPFFPPAVFISAVKTIDRRRLKLYFHFCSENADRFYLSRLQRSLDGFVEEIPRHRTIFLSVIHGSLSTTVLRSIIRDWGGYLTSIPIHPSITYFGIGAGVDESRFFYTSLYQPRFYVYKVKSKDDIKARIEVVLHWIEQHQDLFFQIHRLFYR